MGNGIMISFRKFWESDRGLSIFLLLLVAIVFVVPPLFSPGWVARLVLDVVFALLLVAGIAAVPASRTVRVILTAVAVAAIGLRWVDQIVVSQGLDLAAAASTVASCGLLSLVVLAQVFRPGPVTSYRVQGAVAAYLMLGLTWAAAYNTIGILSPGAFAGPTMDLGGGVSSFVYFSFVTLTTVGYGDVTPVHPIARSLATLEALTGQLYPAILLARLVSLQLLQGNDVKSTDD
jgi:hypothetical protein